MRPGHFKAVHPRLQRMMEGQSRSRVQNAHSADSVKPWQNSMLEAEFYTPEFPTKKDPMRSSQSRRADL